MKDEFTDVELLIAALREPSREVARLYLAGQALTGLLSNPNDHTLSTMEDKSKFPALVGRAAKVYADACVAALYP
jgi:hypothetical protein